MFLPAFRLPRSPGVLAAALALVLLTALVAGGCGSGSEDGARSGKTLIVATHDSWAMDDAVLEEFTASTGITVKIRPQGDAGTLTNKLVLTKDNPIADGVFGIDNSFASRAVDEGVLEPSAARVPESARAHALTGEAGTMLAPIDYGDVCVNIDDAWFSDQQLAPPQTLDDLVKPAYRDLLVVPGATTSSPGLAFLLATIAAKGESGWQAYWKALIDNGAKVVAGWTDAYEGDFTAGGGQGSRPVVVSYSSSPPSTIPDGGERPTTSALLGTCFRQVEYAGVLAGSKNPDGMRRFIEFMLGKRFQAALPEQMYVYPVDRTVSLPPQWEQFAPPSPSAYSLDPATITAHRSAWLREWRDLTTR